MSLSPMSATPMARRRRRQAPAAAARLERALEIFGAVFGEIAADQSRRRPVGVGEEERPGAPQEVASDWSGEEDEFVHAAAIDQLLARNEAVKRPATLKHKGMGDAVPDADERAAAKLCMFGENLAFVL